MQMVADVMRQNGDDFIRAGTAPLLELGTARLGRKLSAMREHADPARGGFEKWQIVRLKGVGSRGDGAQHAATHSVDVEHSGKTRPDAESEDDAGQLVRIAIDVVVEVTHTIL